MFAIHTAGTFKTAECPATGWKKGITFIVERKISLRFHLVIKSGGTRTSFTAGTGTSLEDRTGNAVLASTIMTRDYFSFLITPLALGAAAPGPTYIHISSTYTYNNNTKKIRPKLMHT